MTQHLMAVLQEDADMAGWTVKNPSKHWDGEASREVSAAIFLSLADPKDKFRTCGLLRRLFAHALNDEATFQMPDDEVSFLALREYVQTKVRPQGLLFFIDEFPGKADENFKYAIMLRDILRSLGISHRLVNLYGRTKSRGAPWI